MMVEIEDPQLGPLPLARPLRSDSPRLVGVEAGAVAEARLVQPEAVAGIDDALRRLRQRHDPLGRGDGARKVGTQRIAGMRDADPRIFVQQDGARQAEQRQHEADQAAGPAVQRVEQFHHRWAMPRNDNPSRA